MRAVNREGLTLVEWINAAGYKLPAGPRLLRAIDRSWLAGEDPTEHRAAIETARATGQVIRLHGVTVRP